MKSTVVSFYPAPISETKPGLIPNEFAIPASVDGKPALLIVDDGKYYYKAMTDSPTIPVPVLGQEICRSLVEDFIRAKQACVPGEKQPAIFFLEGEWTVETLLRTKKEIVETYLAMQAAWFMELVKLADNDWAKSPGSHRLITEDAKRAAKELKFERDWLLEMPKNITPIASKTCKGCATEIPASAIVCRFCQTVQDKDAYKHLTVVGKAVANA